MKSLHLTGDFRAVKVRALSAQGIQGKHGSDQLLGSRLREGVERDRHSRADAGDTKAARSWNIFAKGKLLAERKRKDEIGPRGSREKPGGIVARNLPTRACTLVCIDIGATQITVRIRHDSLLAGRVLFLLARDGVPFRSL